MNNIIVLYKLYANDLTMRYKDGSQFKCKLVDCNGILLANETINFNINGIFFNEVTDNAGIAKLNINLQSGEYIITSSYDIERIVNTIKIMG